MFPLSWPVSISNNPLCLEPWTPQVNVPGVCTQAEHQNRFFFYVNHSLSPYPFDLTYVLDAQKDRLIETVLLSTHNISFG